MTVAGTEHQIATDESKIHIVCKSAALSTEEITYKAEDKETVVLDFETVVYHADRVNNLHKRTEDEVRTIFPGFKWPFPRPWTNAVRSVVGFVDMTLKIHDLKPNALLVWKHPETFLHPAECANLADLIIRLHKSPNESA